MNSKQKVQDPILAITHFLTSDLLQEEIQQLPNDLQELFDFVLDSHYGDNLATRRKMLRIKELAILSAKSLKPFSEEQVQYACLQYQKNRVKLKEKNNSIPSI